MTHQTPNRRLLSKRVVAALVILHPNWLLLLTTAVNSPELTSILGLTMLYFTHCWNLHSLMTELRPNILFSKFRTLACTLFCGGSWSRRTNALCGLDCWARMNAVSSMHCHLSAIWNGPCVSGSNLAWRLFHRNVSAAPRDLTADWLNVNPLKNCSFEWLIATCRTLICLQTCKADCFECRDDCGNCSVSKESRSDSCKPSRLHCVKWLIAPCRTVLYRIPTKLTATNTALSNDWWILRVECSLFSNWKLINTALSNDWWILRVEWLLVE